VYNNDVLNSYNLASVVKSFVFFNGSDYKSSYACNIEESILKTYASQLGSTFKSDNNNINDGYPILSWQ